MSAAAATEGPHYPLGHAGDELDRLDVQGRALAPATETILALAGLEPGMRVLDLGSGSGDLSLTAARIVGAGGEVTGIDRVPDAAAHATARADRLGATNVHFHVQDMRRPAPGGPYDAVICRLALMYAPDPAAVLATHARSLRPGGLTVAIEFDVTTCSAHPRSPLLERAVAHLTEAFRRGRIPMRLGPRLWTVLGAAGLDPVDTIAIQPLFAPTTGTGPALLAGVVRSSLGLLDRTGLGLPPELEPDRFEDALRAEQVASQAVIGYPMLHGAWARRRPR